MPKLHVVDYVVVAVYLGFIAVLGSSFARRQKSTDRYYTGGRNVPTWAIGLSMLATLISSVTFLAYPGEGYAESSWIRLVQGLMVPIVLLCLIWFIVPMFRKVIGISTYEYFEKRFGLIPRIYTSLSFSLMHFAKMGTVFYLMALAVGTMMGVGSPMGLTYLIIILGVLVVVYTLLGGIEAVIWCDVIQGIVLMAAGVMVVLTLFFKGGGPIEMVSTAWNAGKIDFTPLEPAFKWEFVRLGFWVMAINGIFYAIQKYGTDQTIIQRYLTAGSDKKAIKASLMGILLCVPVWTLFMFIGTMLWVYYQSVEIPAEVLEWIGDKPERVFVYYVNSEFPIGIVGVVLAGLCAAALSSLDSDLNCLSAVVVEDYYGRFRKNRTDRQKLMCGRLVIAICGLYAILVASWYVRVQDAQSVLSIIFGLYAILSGGIAGLFVLAFFTKRTNLKGLYVGMIACILFSAWAVLTGEPLVGDKSLIDLNMLFNNVFNSTALGTDEGQFTLNFPHHHYMIGVYSHIVLCIFGYVASFFFKQDKDISGLTFSDWRRTHTKIADAVREV
ncbi:MAG: sodium:solute symporter family transporter [Planctomycetota bacterium]|jgi:SSS family solute:Na+ symporter